MSFLASTIYRAPPPLPDLESHVLLSFAISLSDYNYEDYTFYEFDFVRHPAICSNINKDKGQQENTGNPKPTEGQYVAVVRT